MIAQWPNGADVLFNPANDSLPAGEMEASIKYACWSIRERTGIDLRYAGQTTKRDIVGKIIVTIALPADYAEVGLPDYFWYRGYAHIQPTQDGSYEKVRIGIGRHWHGETMNIGNKRTIVHELLHACGMDHNEVDGAVMSSPFNQMFPYCYGLMCCDFMPIQRGGNHSFVELTMEHDLLIPCIQGKTAHLEYTGDGATHKWKIKSLRDAGPMSVESAVTCADMRKPDLVFTDVRSQVYGNLTRVELEYDLAKEEWLLKSAS